MDYNLDRFIHNLMLKMRWLFANLLQSPRSAGWFLGTTHFYRDTFYRDTVLHVENTRNRNFFGLYLTLVLLHYRAY